MSLRLKSRQNPIPHGNQFYDPVLKWRARANMSFQGIVDGLQIARLANPGLTKSKGLATDKNQIAAEVDLYLATICKANGWVDYYLEGDGGSPVPFPQGRNPRLATSRQPIPPNPLVQKLANVVGGSSTLVDWITSGAEAVPQEQAEARAAVCVKCPLNGKGGWERWFTQPVSNALNATFLRKNGMKLQTTHDADLGVCTACDCPMGLKVWMKLESFYGHMTDDAKARLDAACWIRSETIAQ